MNLRERDENEEETMKKAVILCMAIVALVLFVPVALSAQEQSEAEKVTIKSKEVNNGVVILAVHGVKNSFELQCNKGATGCTLLDPGEYIMVRLPKNHGLYDCANAEVYRKSADTQTGDKMGQYCLVETK
jgi:hypothetical protein